MMPTVNVSFTANTITLDPDPVVADKFSRPTIFWAVGSVRGNKVQAITSIDIEAWTGSLGGPRQPTAVAGSTSWQVLDPNEEARNFKYTVTVALNDGTTETIDPTIQNQGQGP